MRTSPDSPCFCAYTPNLSPIAARNRGSRNGFGGLDGQTSRNRGMSGFGDLGAFGATNPIITTGLSAVGGAAGGAVAGALSGAAAGSIIPGIGTAIGAVVGALSGGLFGHADHAAINAAVAQRKNLASQYMQIAGTVAGRTIGQPAMRDKRERGDDASEEQTRQRTKQNDFAAHLQIVRLQEQHHFKTFAV